MKSWWALGLLLLVPQYQNHRYLFTPGASPIASPVSTYDVGTGTINVSSTSFTLSNFSTFAGNNIFCALAFAVPSGGFPVPTISNNFGATFVRTGATNGQGAFDGTYILWGWYAGNLTASTTLGATITATFPSAISWGNLRCKEYSSVDPITPLDPAAVVFGSATATPVTTGSFRTAAGFTHVVMFVVANGCSTVSAAGGGVVNVSSVNNPTSNFAVAGNYTSTTNPNPCAAPNPPWVLSSWSASFGTTSTSLAQATISLTNPSTGTPLGTYLSMGVRGRTQ